MLNSAQTNSVDFPTNAAGDRGRALLKMGNSNGDADLKDFIEKEMMPNNGVTLEKRLQLFQRIRDDLKNAKLRKVFGFTVNSISFAIEKTDGTLLKFNVEFEPENNNRISGLGVELISPDELNQAPEDTKSVSDAELIPKVEEFLNELTQKDEFSGVVLIAKEGKPIFHKAYGQAVKEFGVSNQKNTKFNIGSINKVFTTLAIGILADEGKIKLSDTIDKILPDYPNKDAAKKITIYHLLTMTSGIGDFFNEEYDAIPKDKLRSINDYLPLFASKPLLFEPGKGEQYSNGGFLVLGAIIEKVSGKSYYDFVRERIFLPIGMKDTDSYEMDSVVMNRAVGYTNRGNGKTTNKKVNNIYTTPAKGSSAGGGYSTAEDFLKFTNAIDSGKFPIPRSLKESKGILTVDMLLKGLRAGGGANGINALIMSKLPRQYTVVVFANYDPPIAERIGRQILNWIGKDTPKD